MSNCILFDYNEIQDKKENDIDMIYHNEYYSKNSEKTIKYLTNFIKRNYNLLHIDLSNTGLSIRNIYKIAVSLRTAKSLRAIHLSDNNISEQLVDEIVCRIHGVKNGKSNFVQFINN